MSLKISRSAKAHSTYEYGCDLRRIYPWKDVADPLFWGAAIASVRVGDATTPHSHDEEETFFVLSGNGMMTIDGETAPVGAQDVVYLPRGSTHTLANIGTDQPLVFLTVYWGSPEARASLRDVLAVEPAAWASLNRDPSH
jgi:oxalate decarboxylase/phosphoglucose isomerase-like protein (cupin superfamily)